MVRVEIIEKVAFEQRLKINEGMSHVCIEGEYFRGSNQRKDPKRGKFKEHKSHCDFCKNNEERGYSKVRTEKAVENSVCGLVGHCKDISFYSE